LLRKLSSEALLFEQLDAKASANIYLESDEAVLTMISENSGRITNYYESEFLELSKNWFCEIVGSSMNQREVVTTLNTCVHTWAS
jgi:hypothetical protein